MSLDLDSETKKVLIDLIAHYKTPQPESSKILDSPDQKRRPSIESSSTEATVEQNNETIEQNDELITGGTRKSGNSKPDEDVSKPELDGTKQTSATEIDVFRQPTKTRTIEITLRADSEFFDLLKNELTTIDSLQARQKYELTSQVHGLSDELSLATNPMKSGTRSEMYAWREIFSLYNDAAPFFDTTEKNHGFRTGEQARERIQWFSNQLISRSIVRL